MSSKSIFGISNYLIICERVGPVAFKGTDLPSLLRSIAARLSPQPNFLLTTTKGTSWKMRKDSGKRRGRNLWGHDIKWLPL